MVASFYSFFGVVFRGQSVDGIVLIVAAVGIEVCCILATGKLNAKVIEIIHVLLLFHLFHGLQQPDRKSVV